MFKSIYYLFAPHEKNNHRAKLLHNINILLILILFVVASFSSYFIKNARPDVLGVSYSISENELLSLVNKQRQEHGLTPLVYEERLSDAARRKAADMLEKDYWAHFAPDGSTTPWSFIKSAGYEYIFAGENLAKGFTDSSSTVEAWMGSATHRDNILSDKYRDIGFAIIPGKLEGEETVLIVEMFGAEDSSIAAIPATAPEIVPEDVSTREAEIIARSTITPLVAAEATAVNSSPSIDIRTLSKGFSAAGFSFLVFALAIDLVIIERKKIPRIVGHNLDHIMLIVVFVLFIILAKGGVIL